MNRVETLILRCIALVAINGLALVYDSQWLTVAIAADFAVLGYSLKNIAGGEIRLTEKTKKCPQ